VKRIIRHVLPVDDGLHEIEVPVGTDPVLHVASRRMAEIDIWVLDDPAAPTRTAIFRVVGTGHPIDANEHWIGTCVVPGGALVWHLVELWTQ
jgi:hypothetical protein